MKAGISTACLFPMEMAAVLDNLGRQGVPLAECFFNTPTELKRESLRQLAAIQGRWGLSISSVHSFHSEMESFFFFSPYKNRLEDGLEQYERYFEAAALLGAPYLVFHGEFGVGHFDEEEGFGHIERLWELGQRYGVDVLHENVARCKGGDPAYLARLHGALPQLGFVLDMKQALRAGRQPEDFVKVLGSAIRHVHFSDSSPKQDCLLPGQGTADLAGLLQALKNSGADPSVVVEVYSNCVEKPEQLGETWHFCQKLLDSVEKM